MVRLFLPEGEGQHPLTRAFHNPLPEQLKLASLPLQSALYAGGITAFLALVGKSRPGYFLKATAYVSAANLSLAALDGYSKRQINRAIFKLDGVEPSPGRLWVRTKHWTMDDLVIGGGILGTFLALNPRALPGVGGWKRFFGAATIGCATGAFIGPRQIGSFYMPSEAVSLIEAENAQIRQTQYKRLEGDKRAQETLSSFGKLALSFYTWPVLSLSLNPFKAASDPLPSHAAAAATDGFQHTHLSHNPSADASDEDMEQYTQIVIGFGGGELEGPDTYLGARAYNESLGERDANALQDWLEQLERIRITTASEAQYLWQYLTIKEREYYSIPADSRERDITRRELVLLNHMAREFAVKDAIFSYQIADILKRLEQLRNKDKLPGKTVVKLPEDGTNQCSPQQAAALVRAAWLRHKVVLEFFEYSLTENNDLEPEPGSIREAHLQQTKMNVESTKRNLEATGRLLRDLEEQMRKAEEYAGKSRPADP